MNYLIVVDAKKCTGCRICELACSLYNEKECNPEKSKIRVIRSEEKGIIYTVPVLCRQCEQPICMEMCPVKAIYRDSKTGAVRVDQEKCIGCRTCVFVCPFGGIAVDPHKEVAAKCTLCDGEPKCVEFCPKGALQYIRSDKIDLKKKRDSIEGYLEHEKLEARLS